jgi:hypothetical protein
MRLLADFLRRSSLLGVSLACLSLAGCGIGAVTTSGGATQLAITGNVHGGVQPVSGASIQLFAVGNAGNGSQATSLLQTPVYTDSHGAFTLTGDYTCPTSGSKEVYLAARGGNPGLSQGVNNQALILLSALGTCADLIVNPSRFISLNEVSTVAAVYALNPFISAVDHIGASATNIVGITNAFRNAQLLADPATGMAPQLPANLSTETGKLYALADAIVPCVNSDGTSACNALFTAATVNNTRPTDVLQALLNITRNPGANVTAVYNAIGSTPPYPSTLTAAPHDWTMSLAVTGGGLNDPTQLAVDAAGNVWVTNFGADPTTAGLVAFSPQGTPLPGTPFGAGIQTDAYALTLDKNGDPWVASYDNIQAGGQQSGSIAHFQGASSSAPGAYVGQYWDYSLSQPFSVASDPSGSGEILLANYHTGTVTFYDLNGNYLKNLGGGTPCGPTSVTSDTAGGAWVGDYCDHNVDHLLANGSVLTSTCCNTAQSVSLDRHGNIWVSNFGGISNSQVYTFSLISPSGAVLINEQPGAGLFTPGSGAVDAGGQFWVANYYAQLGATYSSISEIAGEDTTVPAGTALSPSIGFGLDAKMLLAYAIAPDPSGNLWVSVQNGNSLRMFFGLATPTATPATPTPQLP